MPNLRNRIILCLGSNFEKEKNMECAVNLLRTHFIFIRFSQPMITTPINCSSSASFINQVALLYTDLNVDLIKIMLKQIEFQLGRRPEDKSKGLIPIDIDLLQCNDVVYKQEDLSRDYVKSGIQSLLSTCKNNEWCK